MATITFAAKSPPGASRLCKRWSKILLVYFILAALLGSFGLARANNVSYINDIAGRLLAVFDGNGNVASYTYDNNGQILSILNESASIETIFGTSPNQPGGPGSTIIYGNNFPNNPYVCFCDMVGNCDAAGVLSATPNQIVTSSGPVFGNPEVCNSSGGQCIGGPC